ncbi:MAG TPA: ABC transporter ATP-binding protein, partial [Longimicrobium sp.]|nr:ABC transporter ATP-binding protein [Longimicrobium sp.]
RSPAALIHILLPIQSVELKIERLSKTYPNGVHALRDVSLTIAPGMFGLLGPNGAGKSTLMRILATLQEADAGRVRLGEIDVLRDKEAVRRTLGYLPQEFGLYPKAGAEEMLDHFALLKGIVDRRERKEVVGALLRQTNLWQVRRQRLGSFSGGMRQRFGIAVALIGNPRLIIVDEPTAGLDPAERARFLNLLSELGENAVVILSTHIVEDVADLCQRMAVIQGGQILLSGEPSRAIAALRGRVWSRQVARDELAAMERDHAVISTTLSGGRTIVHVHADAAPDPSFEPVEPDLKDVYFTAIRGIAVNLEGSAQEYGSAQGPVPSAQGDGDRDADRDQDRDAEGSGGFGRREDDAPAPVIERFRSPDDARPTIHADPLPVRRDDPPPPEPEHGRREEDA